MWLAALLGMTTKFAEVTLAVAYRERNELGDFSGGPMYYIKNGLGQAWLAKIFALFAAFAAFGIGCMVQTNSIASAVNNQFTTDHPVRQGMWGAFEVFVDTLMICSMTALVVITSGLWHSTDLEGAPLTTEAFRIGLPGNIGAYIVTLGLVLFAFTTVIGWCYYGEKSAEYLVNSSKIIVPYRLLFVVLAFVGAIGGLSVVWTLADVLNALMAVPNLIGVLALGGVVGKLSKQFFADPDRLYQPEDYADIARRK